MKLARTKQCKKCPWKVTTNPYDIPDGYSPVKHKNLKSTIATPGDLNFVNMNAMACHHSSGSDNMYCVGWLHNQLGIGNNIGLRIRMLSCDNLKELKVYGRQHERFELTLPK